MLVGLSQMNIDCTTAQCQPSLSLSLCKKKETALLLTGRSCRWCAGRRAGPGRAAPSAGCAPPPTRGRPRGPAWRPGGTRRTGRGAGLGSGAGESPERGRAGAVHDLRFLIKLNRISGFCLKFLSDYPEKKTGINSFYPDACQKPYDS